MNWSTEPIAFMHQIAKKRCPVYGSSLAILCLLHRVMCSPTLLLLVYLLFSILWYVFLLLDFAFLVHDTYVDVGSIHVRSAYECFLYFDLFCFVLLFFAFSPFFLSTLHLRYWPFFSQFVLLSVKTGTSIHLSFYILFHSDIFDWFSSSSCVYLCTHFVSFWWQSNKKNKMELSVPSDLCRAVDCRT